MINVTASFIEPRRKDGRPKLTAKSTPRANSRRDVVVCVGGFANGWTRDRRLFVDGVSEVGREFSPAGRYRETPRFTDGPRARGRVARILDRTELVLARNPATHFARHYYRFCEIDGRAYWAGLDAALVADTAATHVAKALARKAAAAERTAAKEAA